METEYKPMFNRTYLKMVLLGCVLAIVWLTSMDKSAQWEAGRIEDSAVYWLEQSNEQAQLQILLTSQGAISDAEQDRQQLRKRILETRLNQLLGPQAAYQVLAADDHLNIVLSWQDGLLPLEQLLDSLAQPVNEQRWQAELKRIEAARYLKQRQLEQQILANFRNQLGNNQAPLPLQWNSLFLSPRIVFSGEDAEQHAEELAQQIDISSKVIEARRSLPSLTGSYQLDDRNTQAMLLLGTTLASRTSDQFLQQRLAAEVLQLLLARYQPVSGSEYRLLWKSLLDGGYQAIVFFSPNSIDAAALQQLANQADEALIVEAKQRLQQRWQLSSTEAPRQRAAMGLLALYDLPLDSLSQYQQQLEALDIPQLLATIRANLDPQQQYTLRIQPTSEEN